MADDVGMATPSAGKRDGQMFRQLVCLVPLVFSIGLIQGCATFSEAPTPPVAGEGIEQADLRLRLEEDLASLLGFRDGETAVLAHTLLLGTDNLARKYRIQPPALWHNFLVNLGLRERGLCCHWTQDLLQEIKSLQLHHFQAFWGVSRHGTWREHNSVIVVAAGKEIHSGLVVDPWRSAGQPYWVRVADDGYDWQHHPGDNGTSRIRCR